MIPKIDHLQWKVRQTKLCRQGQCNGVDGKISSPSVQHGKKWIQLLKQEETVTNREQKQGLFHNK